MKIIEDNYNKTKEQITCLLCASILEYQKSDVKWDVEFNEGICDYDIIHYIHCPLCGIKIEAVELK